MTEVDPRYGGNIVSGHALVVQPTRTECAPIWSKPRVLEIAVLNQTAFLQTIRRAPLGGLPWKRSGPPCCALKCPAFLALLDRERAIADRHDRVFSLLIYESVTTHDQHYVKTVTDTITRRVRCSDTLGWIDETSLGVLLPCTESDGATHLAQSLSGLLPADFPLVTVFSYPLQERNNDEPGGPLESAGHLDEEPDFLIPTQSPRQQLAPSTPIWKRSMDVVGSLVGLILLSPLLLVVGVLIKTTSSGPVFFRQQRVGYMGRPFTMWKFRTMVVDVDTAAHERYVTGLVKNGQPLNKMNLHEHLIPAGKWLRRLCIDELPQLINVLIGNMSLVGPRPDVVPMARYLPWQRRRFDELPGMTGLWQVSGKNSTTLTQMIRLDISYSARRCLALDAVILLKTVPAILSQVREQQSN